MCLAVPGKILTTTQVDDFSRVGKVDFDGVCQEVNLSYLPDAKVGDYVIVHVGFAISKWDQQAAQRTLDYLAAMEGP